MKWSKTASYLSWICSYSGLTVLKLRIYRKPTSTDQYLNFKFHHPVEHKLSMMRILLQRSLTLVTDSQDKLQEDSHVEEALRACGYPEWSFRKVKHQLKSRTTTKNNRKKHQESSSKRPVIVIPYVEKVSETIARITKMYNVHVTMNLGER